MAGLFRRFFGDKRSTDRRFTETLRKEVESVYDPVSETDRIGLGLLVVLAKQLELLGFELGAVPFDAQYGSDQCRGALLGTALAIVRAESVEPSNKQNLDTANAAFSLVYGKAAGGSLLCKRSAMRLEAMRSRSGIGLGATGHAWRLSVEQPD
jgi:hypothetical protein